MPLVRCGIYFAVILFFPAIQWNKKRLKKFAGTMSALLLGAGLSMIEFTELYQPAYKNIKLSGIETVLTEAAGTGNDILVEDILIEVNEEVVFST